MATITKVTLRNFRGFARLEKLRLAPLTFLVGPNSSGKSSVADALLFMAQSGFLSLEATNPLWIGPLVDLGSFKDTVFRHETKRAIEIHVELDAAAHRYFRLNRKIPWQVEIAAQINTAKDAPEGRLRKLRVGLSETTLSAELVRRSGRRELFHARTSGKVVPYDPQLPWSQPALALSSVLRGMGRGTSVRLLRALVQGSILDDIVATVQRVSSGRDPPKRSYRRDSGVTNEQIRWLIDGIDPIYLEDGRKRDSNTFRAKIVEGLLSLGIADELLVTRIGDYHADVRLRDDRTGIVSNLAEFGYGASQVIPVLEGCAGPGEGPLFVEQPEIHLHPRAQGELAQILCDASKQRQMIVETHSEHMINRARRLVAEGKMKAGHVIIHYIDRGKDGSYAETIGVDEMGDFTRDWPDGFYDERYRETMKIAEAQARRVNARGRRAAG